MQNNKTPSRGIFKMHKYATFMEKMPNVVKMSILFKLIYRANATLIKNTSIFLV